jgi:hypothetical protein
MTFEAGARRSIGYLLEVSECKPIDAYQRRDANALREFLRERGLAKESIARECPLLGTCDPTNSSGGKCTFPRRGIVKYNKLRISIELERCRILIVAKPQRQIQAVKGIPIALEKNVAIA